MLKYMFSTGKSIINLYTYYKLSVYHDNQITP